MNISESIIDEILDDSSYKKYYDNSTEEGDTNYFIIQNTSNFIQEHVSFSIGNILSIFGGFFHHNYLLNILNHFLFDMEQNSDI